MPTGNITKRSVDALQPGVRDTFLWDKEVRGFGIKLTPRGTLTYVFQYRLGGREAKVRRYTIGSHGHWTPHMARAEAARLAVLVDCGIDPAKENESKQQEAVDYSFEIYAERFANTYLRTEWRGSHHLATGILRRDVIPAFKFRPLRQITRRDISALMDQMADRPASRRNAFAVLRRLFSWAVSRGDLEASPFQHMEAPPAPPSRDRVLSDSELQRVWHGSIAAGYPFGPFVRMLLLTGQRREEVSGLVWEELNRADALWTLPAGRAKNRTTHEVPLAAAVMELLDQVAAHQLTSAPEGSWPRAGFVFTKSGGQAVTGFSAAKARLDRLISTAALTATESSAGVPQAGPAPWRFHDLRRTLATGLQRLGVRFEVTEAVLNHLSGSRSGIAGVYQRYHWSAEKREALDRWAEHVLQQVTRS